MIRIKTHKARLPSEEDVVVVSVGNDHKIAEIFFVKEKQGVYREIEHEVRDGYDAMGYIIRAAKALIREGKAGRVYGEEDNIVAELRIGEVYEQYE